MSKKRELMNLVERITENEAEIFLKCIKSSWRANVMRYTCGFAILKPGKNRQ